MLSRNVILNLVILGSVIEGNNPRSFNFKNKGNTDPLLPKTFPYQKDGLSTSIDYTAEELSFMKKRSGEYAKELLSAIFASDEYNDPTLDNFVKQEFIKGAFSSARNAAKADLLFNSDETSDEYEEYPEVIMDNEVLGLEVVGKGPYENSLNLRTRIESEIRSNLLSEIRTKNRGQDLAKPEDQYFTGIEE